MQNSKNCLEDNAPNSRLMGEEILFPFSENVPKLSYSNADFKNFPGDNILGPFQGLNVSVLRKCTETVYSPTAMQN